MKTLKKNLCLVLAMVMVLGLCTISASAKLEYADNDAINYEEAVDVLSGLGILKGSASGFRPTATITRAEAAKILAYIMIGNAEQADALKASTDPFTDVPASHWASGYISYCNTRGIILGVGDGSYRPNSSVTNIQFALMLLRALGYGTQNEYSGSDWPVKVAADAIRLGVFDDNLAGANTDPATREACALYAFNVIARNRDGQVGLKKVTYSSLAGDYVANGAFSGAGTGLSVDANKKSTFALDFGLYYRNSDPDVFGREIGHHWVQKVGNSYKTITADYPDNGKQIALYTTGVTGDDLYNLLVDEFGKAAYDAWNGDTSDLSVYTNSASAAAVTTDGTKAGFDKTASTGIVKGNTKTLKGTGNGVQTYVYAEMVGDPAALSVRVCIIDTYLVKVDDVTEGTAKKDPVTSVDALSQDSGSSDPLYGATLTYNTDDFAEGEYVLITVADGEIQSMVPAAVVESEISRFDQVGSKKTITVDGTTYAPAEQSVKPDSTGIAASAIDKTVVDGEQHKIYVDNYGYVIGIGTVSKASEYVYAARFGKSTGHGNDFDDEGVSVQVYYADGTSKVLPLKLNENNAGATYGGSTNLTLSDFNNKEGIYKLTMKSGKAVLVDAITYASGTTSGLATQSATGDVNRGFASTVTADSTNADNKTVFFYVKSNSGTYYTWDESAFKVTAYIGINNVPVNKPTDASDGSANADKALVTQAAADGTKKVAAVLVKDELKGETTDTVYFYTGDYNNSRTDWAVTYDTYVDGKLAPLTIPYDSKSDRDTAVANFEDNWKYKFFTLDSDDKPTSSVVDGTATAAVNKSLYLNETAATAMTDYEITVGSAYSINGMTIIDLTGENTTLKTLKTDVTGGTKTVKVALQTNEQKVITYLYITDIA